jgi:DNA-directed RNA polymerase subunit RPC12/RpoP
MIKYTYECDKCGREIKERETYFKWERRHRTADGCTTGSSPGLVCVDGIVNNWTITGYDICAECDRELRDSLKKEE